MRASVFFTPEQQAGIVRAIGNAEDKTSGEIRVHLETSCKGDVLDEAAWLFRKLGMHNTAKRNGVLIYVATRERKFAIVGDAGINNAVAEGFWDEVRDHMQKRFMENRIAEGLIEGILMTGDQLKNYFPNEDEDINQLPDAISSGETD
jgi:uncharacterized membrane protein